MESAKILIIDDEPTIHKALQKALKGKGYELYYAYNGEEGLKVKEAIQPNLIFLDLRMPVMDGISFLKNINIKAEDSYQVVVVTAHGDEQEVRKSYDLGVNFFIRKPISLPEITGLTKRCIDLKRYEDEIRSHRNNLKRLVENRTRKIREQLHFQQNLIDSIPTPIFFKNLELKYLGCNTAFENMFGITKEQVIGHTVHDIFPEDLADIHHQKDLLVLASGRQSYGSPIPDKSGADCYVMVNKATFSNTNNETAGLIGAMFDISDRKQSADALSARTRELEEANSALRVVLDQIGNAKQDVERKVFRNIKEFIIPDLEKIKAGLPNRKQKMSLDKIKSNLNKLARSPAQKIAAINITLSPREIQIADLIRLGRSNKSIAIMLNISKSAVEFHRNSLREKLGLKHKRMNLRSYLMNTD